MTVLDERRPPVRRKRSAADQQIADLLVTAKKSLDLGVAFLSRLDGTTQHLEVVETSVPGLVQEGAKVRQDTSFCQAILAGELPAVIPDVTRFPAAMALPSARIPRIRSYVSTPVTLGDGTLYGTFCAFGLRSDKELGKRDEALMKVLASAAAVIVEPEVRDQERRTEIEGRLEPVVTGGGPVVLLQPIVDLGTGNRVGAEALSRFPTDWGRTPDVVFAEAHSVGMGHALELQALARAAGLRLAIDDVGAGFSSLRHIVATAPDVIKLDRSITAGVSTDRVLSTLVGSLVTFAHGSGARVVAEGVETAEDATALRALGVDHGQGWHFGRPGPPEALALPVPRTAVDALPAAALSR
jgi:EAL domain-containing protein (putative c-di-GMP-specific phosphodiesterase class I)